MLPVQAAENFDVLIVGAGVSGIGMACTLVTECPGKTFAILEARERPGGTWDLFRYPGVRSDSDMFTYGYERRPWHDARSLADGESILSYLADTRRAFDIDRHICLRTRITQAAWSSTAQHWTVDAIDEAAAVPRRVVCRQLVMATGYFRYDAGYTPPLPGLDRFTGTVIHPQHWPDAFDGRGKRVVVLGSGATAVSLVPALAAQGAQGAQVTMLQRSPGYLLSLPAFDAATAALARVMPARWAHALARRRNVAVSRWLYRASRRWPARMRRLLLRHVQGQLRGTSIDMRHFTPSYQPWDERLCIVADGDFFRALRAGKASVVTDHVAGFDGPRILLRSGDAIDADVLVTATGLELEAFGGARIVVDGRPVQPREHMFYKGALLDGVPNFAWIVGYINASWTLKVDLVTSWLSRLYRHMDAHGAAVVTARDARDGAADTSIRGGAADASILDGLSAGYVARARDRLPRQGREAPWIVTHNLEADRRALRDDAFDDAALVFDVGRGAGVAVAMGLPRAVG